MIPPQGTCPGIAEIERLAEGSPPSVDAAKHIQDCPACQERLQAAKEDAAFLGKLRTLSRRPPAPDGSPRIPGYRVLSVLNVGAQGVVYRGVQESTAREVAIKTWPSGTVISERQRLRAEREAEIAARLRHPNIVTVFESRTLGDGRTAVVMEFVNGLPLDAWQPTTITPTDRHREVIRVFIAICGAVHHAHLNGVIHRDLKPDNILVTADGRPVVLDFGIAKAGGIRTTVTGEFAGTPGYASPEQASGHADHIDALTDVYSLGVILYRLVCGAMPYELEGSIFEMARTISEVEPVAPRLRNATVSPDLQAIVLRAMRKDKTARYQSAASLARDLERYLSGAPVDARSGSGWYLLRKAVVVNRRRLAWAGVACVGIIIAGVAVALSLSAAAESSKHAKELREQAHAERVRARAVTELLSDALPNADPSRPEIDVAIGEGLSRLYFKLESGLFADDPDMEQHLRRMWGEVYTGLGSGKAAGLIEYSEDSLRNGLIQLRAQHGPEHPDIAATLHDLAGVMLLRHRLDEAERSCRQAVLMREKLLGPMNPATGDSHALRARILEASGRGEDAIKEADAAFVIYQTLPSLESDLQIAAVAALKGRILLATGNAHDSEPWIKMALVRRLRRLFPEEPDLHSSLMDLAELASKQPDSEFIRECAARWNCSPAALPAALRADIRTLKLPDRGTYKRVVFTGRFDALGRLLRLQETFVGENDPALLTVLTAQLRASSGERKIYEGIAAMLRGADIVSKRTGPHGFAMLVYVDQAAAMLSMTQRFDEAIEQGRRACEIWEAVPPEARDVLLMANTRRRYASALTFAGRWAQAVPEFDLVLADLERVVGKNHRSYAMAEAHRAFCKLHLGDKAEAEAGSKHALDVVDAQPATPEDQLAQIRFVRGHVLRALGDPKRLPDAKQELELGWTIIQFTGLECEYRRICINDLVSVSESLGDEAAADRWRGEMLHDSGITSASAESR